LQPNQAAVVQQQLLTVTVCCWHQSAVMQMKKRIAALGAAFNHLWQHQQAHHAAALNPIPETHTHTHTLLSGNAC
jgi:hypothetical protein